MTDTTTNLRLELVDAALDDIKRCVYEEGCNCSKATTMIRTVVVSQGEEIVQLRKQREDLVTRIQLAAWRIEDFG